MGLIEQGRVYQDMYMRTMDRLMYLVDKQMKETGTNEKTYLPLDWRWYCNFMTKVENPVLSLGS